MYIDSIELVDYVRLELNHIKYIKLNFTALMQFLIGTNGSGKSAVFHQLSPLPGEKEDFAPKGKKTIACKHQNSNYLLISDYSKEHVHQFIKDGVNLNDGGTISVQKDLVKKHFHYDNQIHDIVMGYKKFTAMGPGERKHWFTYLSDADYDYAIGVFNSIKERLGDMTGALKLAKQRLVIESTRVISEDAYTTLKGECEEIYGIVNTLIELRKPTEQSLDRIHEQHLQLVSRVQVVYDDLQRKLTYARRNNLSTTQERRDARQVVHDELTAVTAEANIHFQNYKEVEKLWNAWQASQIENLANISQEIQAAEEDAEKALKAIVLKLDPQVAPEVIIESCDSLMAWWPSVQDSLHDNRVHLYNREKFEALMREIEALNAQEQAAISGIAHAKAMAEHQEKHQHEGEITCPKCHHGFQLFFDPVKLASAKQTMASRTTDLEKIREQKKELLQQQAAMQNYFQAYRQVVQTFSATPGMATLCTFLVETQVLQNQPDKVSHYLNQYRADAGQKVAATRATQKITAARELLEQTGGNNLNSNDIQSRKDQMELDIARCERRKRELQLQLEVIDKQILLIRSIEDAAAQMESMRDLHVNLVDQAQETIRRTEFAKLLRDFQSLLATKEQALQASDRQLSVIENISTQIKDLSDNIELFKILVKELSPTEGLIAEGIFSFMRRFLNDMNNIIRLVWSYPLEIRPCALESGDSLVLNYKFPVMVDRPTSIRKDISMGSEGMLEIINKVFQVAAMKASKLEKWPLFLDEFGRTFDHRHKHMVSPMITTLLDLGQFDQVFMVSHDFSQYTSLGRSEICVMHEANVVLPSGTVFNKHVVMK